MIKVRAIIHAPHLTRLTAPELAKAVNIDGTPAAPPLPEPSPLAMARNLADAASAWISAGAPVVTQETYSARRATCDACPEWLPHARLGAGKCQACGCTRLKLWLATEHCPLQKWPAKAPETPLQR